MSHVTIYRGMDPISHNVVVADALHNAIHEGYCYNTYYKMTLAAAATGYVEIKTGGKVPHFKEANITLQGNDVEITLIEDPTITDGTTEIPSHNRERYVHSGSVNLTKYFSDPTGISGGVEIDADLLYSESSTGNKSNPTTSNTDLEWVFKKDTPYVVKVVNNSASGVTLFFKWVWYEY